MRHLTSEDETCGLVCAVGGMGRSMSDVARGTFLQGAASMLGWVRVPGLQELWDLWKKRTTCEDCRLKSPDFGMPGEGKRCWCSDGAKAHAGMGNVKNQNVTQCAEHQQKKPNFGLPGEGKRWWCSGCANAQSGVVHIGVKKCEGCQKGPSFGLQGEGKWWWCFGCAKVQTGVVNLSTQKRQRAGGRVGGCSGGWVAGRAAKKQKAQRNFNPLNGDAHIGEASHPGPVGRCGRVAGQGRAVRLRRSDSSFKPASLAVYLHATCYLFRRTMSNANTFFDRDLEDEALVPRSNLDWNMVSDDDDWMDFVVERSRQREGVRCATLQSYIWALSSGV
jgi:hypothetical protein